MSSFRRLLVERRSVDLSHYSDAFLARRVAVRQHATGQHSLESYSRFILTEPGEINLLLDALSVNVTEFFRDEVLSPRGLSGVMDFLAGRNPKRPITIWSAGCASGPEPYTLAILFDLRFGAARPPRDIIVYATDINESRLREAREGCYAARSLAAVPPAVLQSHFDPPGPDGRRRVKERIRKMVHFFRHDLATLPPYSGLDLVLCRNVTIYFTSEAKANLVKGFHRCLSERGLMILGGSELLLEMSLFSPFDAARKIYQKKAVGGAVQ
ncbi:MAG: hypothetical protein A2V88_00390 [Elusimicrobia bacterium RBG_16_66_12]|nr:MAG: hypothetical protein A2V88_00390 [Elusimicrobia bacterium RBG_16_66_12]